MGITRGTFLRGLGGAALMPGALAACATGDQARSAFTPDKTSTANPWTGTPETGAAPLRFAVIGDNTGLARPGVFDQAMKQIRWLQPDFVLSVGDLIEGYNDDPKIIANQWDAIELSIKNVGCPFIFTPGNHDLDNATTQAAWQSRRGAPYHAFTYKGALFMVLNTEDPPTPMPENFARQFYKITELMRVDPQKAEAVIGAYVGQNGGHLSEDMGKWLEPKFGETQLDFVKATLERHQRVAWTFVVLHKPAWKVDNAAFDKIRKMLTGRPHTVFAGHTHYFTHDVFDGHHYINMGMTGGIRHERGPGAMDHTLLVTLAPEGPVFANMRLNALMDAAGATGQTLLY